MKRMIQKTRIAIDEMVACVSQAAGNHVVQHFGDAPEQLEQRIMMSASPLPVDVAQLDPGSNESGSDGFANQADPHLDADTDLAIRSEESDSQSASVVVFIDEGVGALDSYFDAETLKRFEREGVVISQITSDTDGVAAISDFLASHSDVREIHLISHGDGGSLTLGNQTLNADNLSANAGRIATWESAMTGDGEIYIYGCDLASTADGQTLVDSIAALTGRSVAASDDVTGDAAQGGDWELEYTSTASSIDVTITPAHPINSDAASASIAGESALLHFRKNFGGTLAVQSFQEGTDGYNATLDTTLDSAAPSASNGLQQTVGAVSGNNIQQALLKFGGLFGSNGSQIPFGATINSATITLQVTQPAADGEIHLHEMLQAWNESTTYGQIVDGVAQDDVESTLSVTTSVSNGTTSVSFTGANLTAVIQGWANGQDNNGFVLVNSAGTPWEAASSESSIVADRPQLTIDYTAPPPVDPTELWFTTDDDVNGSGNATLSNWDVEDVLSFGGNSLSLGVATDGELNIETNLQSLFGTNNGVRAMHYVTQDFQLSDAARTQVRQGDLIMSALNTFDVDRGVLGTLTIDPNDIVLLRGNSPGDFSTGGTVQLLFDEVTDNFVRALTLVEQDTVIGDTTVLRGDLLFVEAGSGEEDIMHYRATTLGEGNTAGVKTKLIDGSDIDVDRKIGALDLIEFDTTLGGESFGAGELLVSTDIGITVAGTTFAETDMFALTVQTTDMGGSSTSATARKVFDGSDVNLTSSNEDIRSFTIVQNRTNTAPSATNLNQSLSFDSPDQEVEIGNIVVTDPDATERITVVVTLDNPAAGSLTHDSGNGESYDSGSGEWSITGNVAGVNAALSAISFVPNPSNRVTASLGVKVIDQWGDGPAEGTINLVLIPNTAPTIDLGSPVSSIRSDADVLSGIRVADIQISDDGAGANDITLSGTDAANFSVVGNQLHIANNANLTPGTMTVTVNVDDAGITSGTSGDSETFTITVIDPGSGPEANADSFAVTQDNVYSSGTTGVLANDTDQAPGTVTAGATQTYDSSTAGTNFWDDVQGVVGNGWSNGSGVTLSTEPAGAHSVRGISQSYEFDGTGGLTFQTSGDPPGAIANGPVSIELWFKPATLTGRQMLLEFGSSTNGLSIVLDGSNVEFTVAQSSTPVTLTGTTTGMQVGQWTQVVVQVDPTGNLLSGSGAGDMRFLINGQVAAEAANTGITSWTNFINAGLGTTSVTSATSGPANDFAGRIGLIRFYQQNLSIADTQQNYNATAGGLTVTAIDGQTASMGAAHTLSSGATVTVASDGTFQYDSNNAFDHLVFGESATDTFTYQSTDGFGNSVTETVTATIQGTNVAPTSTTSSDRTLEEDSAETIAESTAETTAETSDQEASAEAAETDAPVAAPLSTAAALPQSLDGGVVANATQAEAEENSNDSTGSESERTNGADSSEQSQGNRERTATSGSSITQAGVTGSTHQASSQTAHNYATQSMLASMSHPGQIWEELDQFKDSATAEFNFESVTVGTVGTVSSSMVVGYVVWALRSGVLMSSVLTAMPAWNLLDPLAVVSFNGDDGDSGESLEDIVESGNQDQTSTESES